MSTLDGADEGAITDEDRERCFHIAYLMMEVANEVVREKFRDLLGARLNLDAWLKQLGRKTVREKYVENKVLQEFQFRILYPSKVAVANSLDTLDLSLIVSLINIHRMESQLPQLPENPDSKDHTWEANFVRLRQLRNKKYAHIHHFYMKKHQYENVFKRLKDILKELGVPDEKIDRQYAVISVEKLKELENAYRRLREDEVQSNLQVVQYDVERQLKMVIKSPDFAIQHYHSIGELLQATAGLLSEMETLSQVYENFSVAKDVSQLYDCIQVILRFYLVKSIAEQTACVSCLLICIARASLRFNNH